MHEKRVWAAFVEKRERGFFSKFKTPQLTYDMWHGLRNKRNKLCYNLISLNVIIQKKKHNNTVKLSPSFLLISHASLVLSSLIILHNYKQANHP